MADANNPHNELDIAIVARLATRSDAAQWPAVGSGTVDEAKDYIELNYIDMTDYSSKLIPGFQIMTSFDALGWNKYESDISQALMNVEASITTDNMVTYSGLSLTNYSMSLQTRDHFSINIPTGAKNLRHGQLRIVFKMIPK